MTKDSAKSAKAPHKEQEGDALFCETEEATIAGRQNFWGSRIYGKKSSAAVPARGTIYEKFYAGNAIIKGQVVIQKNDLFDVIIMARFSFFLI